MLKLSETLCVATFSKQAVTLMLNGTTVSRDPKQRTIRNLGSRLAMCIIAILHKVDLLVNKLLSA